MKRKVTIELTFPQAKVIYEILQYGPYKAAENDLYSQQQLKVLQRASLIIKDALENAFGERLHDTP